MRDKIQIQTNISTGKLNQTKGLLTCVNNRELISWTEDIRFFEFDTPRNVNVKEMSLVDDSESEIEMVKCYNTCSSQMADVEIQR